MNTLVDIQNIPTKLKILKSLLSNTITDTEVIELLQEEIDKMQAEIDAANEGVDNSDLTSMDELGSAESIPDASNDDLASLFGDFGTEEASIAAPEGVPSDDTSLPSPADLGVGDMSDSTNPELQ